MITSVASERDTDGAAAPPLWARPDPALAAAGIEGEYVVARVRLFAMGLLLRDGETLTADFRAGIAGTPNDAEATTAKALLTCADSRLLAAKRRGRGRCIASEWTEEERAASAGPAR